MSKQSISASTRQIRFTEDLADHPIIQWIMTNKRYLLFGFLGLFLLLIVSYRLISSTTLKAEEDFFRVQMTFNAFQEKAIHSKESSESLIDLNQLISLMDLHPELHAKYDGLIAQSLLIENLESKARPFAEQSFIRTKGENLDFYHEYAKTTLLIGAARYEEALTQTKQLKENLAQIETGNSFGETLYAFNLIRLATLYQQLGQSEQELQTWNEVEQYRPNQETLMALHQLFSEPSSLEHYIKERRRILNSSS